MIKKFESFKSGEYKEISVDEWLALCKRPRVNIATREFMDMIKIIPGSVANDKDSSSFFYRVSKMRGIITKFDDEWWGIMIMDNDQYSCRWVCDGFESVLELMNVIRNRYGRVFESFSEVGDFTKMDDYEFVGFRTTHNPEDITKSEIEYITKIINDKYAGNGIDISTRPDSNNINIYIVPRSKSGKVLGDGIDIVILKYDDEWWLVRVVTDDIDGVYDYKCDGFDSMIKLISLLRSFKRFYRLFL